MFRHLQSNSLEQLLELSDKFLNHHKNPICSLRCLDHAFSSPSLFHDMTFETAPQTLRYFKSYTEVLQIPLFFPDPLKESDIQKLLAINKISDEEFIVANNSILLNQKYALNDAIHTLRTGDGGSVISRWELMRLMAWVLRKHLHTRITEENRACHASPVFRMCLQAAVFGMCRRERCQAYHMQDTSPFKAREYNTLVRIHLQQIMIYDAIHPFGSINPWEQAEQRRSLN